MIAEKDIVTVKLEPVCDVGVPMPRYIKEGCSPVTRNFVVLGDEVTVTVLGLDRAEFRQQLEQARRFRASLVGVGADGQRYGVSPQGSKIKHGDRVMDKNMFIPSHLLERPDKRVSTLFVAYFIRTDPLAIVSEAEVAGWIDFQGLMQLQAGNPEQFKSKIRTVAVPCQKLYPMQEFPSIHPEAWL